MIDASKLKAIPIDTLRELNRAVVEEIRRRNRVSAVMAIGQFTRGDIVCFNAKKRDGALVTGVVTDVKRSRVHVRETRPIDRQEWVVNASVLRQATAD